MLSALLGWGREQEEWGRKVFENVASGEMHLILDAMPFFVFLIDERHEIAYANRTAQDAGGRAPAGALCPRLMHDAGAPFSGCPLEEVVRSGVGATREFEEPAGSGRWLRVEVHPTALRTAKGEALFLHLAQDVTAQRRAQSELRRNVDVQAVINRLLKMDGLDEPLERIMHAAIEMLLSLPWLVLEPRGAVFLVDEPGKLRMTASYGMDAEAKATCALVPFGQCLCGTAAMTGEVVFAPEVQHAHTTRYAAISPHGHYCVPIVAGGLTLGVINVYLRAGHARSEPEVELLRSVAATLAGIIRHRKAAQARDRLAAVVEETSDFVGMADRQGRALYANRAMRTLVGVGDSNFRIEDCHPPWARRVVLHEAIPAAIRDGHWAGETALLSADGQEIPVSQVVLAHKRPDGGLEYLSTIIRDIRAQREALGESEERYRNLVETSPDATLVHDGRLIRYANRAALELFGARSADELVGTDIFERIDAQDRDIAVQRSRAALDGAPTPIRQMRYVRLDGAPLDVETTSSRVTVASVPCVLLIVRDIGPRLRLQRELAVGRQRLELAQQAGRIGVFDWDRDTGEVLWTPELEELHGLAAGQFGGRVSDWHALAHPDDRDVALQAIDDALRERGSFELQYRVVIPGGRVRWHAATGRAYPVDNRGMRRVVGVIVDITERKETEQRLQEALRSRDQFLAILSHELRTPLTPALMTSSSLESSSELPASLKPEISLVRRAIEMEARLIDDLLDVTRISRGKLRVHHEPVDPSDALQVAIEVCRADAAEKQLELAFELGAPPCTLQGESARLQQVFWNLLRNAIKFTPAGGRVTVATAIPEGTERLEVRITDTGQGIDPGVMPRLFQAFEQGSEWVTRRFGGLGLGLAISKALVTMHGGTIEAHSAGLNQGSTFLVTLPVQRARARVSRPPASAAPKEQCTRRLRILVVDDDKTTALVTAGLLGKLGHQVETAASLSEGLRVFLAHPFDLLVSDLGLPDGSGLELLREIRKHKDIRAIALSGYGMESDLAKSREAGFLDHLIKPVRFDQLAAAVDAACRSLFSA